MSFQGSRTNKDRNKRCHAWYPMLFYSLFSTHILLHIYLCVCVYVCTSLSFETVVAVWYLTCCQKCAAFSTRRRARKKPKKKEEIGKLCRSRSALFMLAVAFKTLAWGVGWRERERKTKTIVFSAGEKTDPDIKALPLCVCMLPSPVLSSRLLNILFFLCTFTQKEREREKMWTALNTRPHIYLIYVALDNVIVGGFETSVE